MGVGGHAHARKDLGDKQAGAEGRHQEGDVPVDRAVGQEAHLTQGLDEQEAAAGGQTRHLGFDDGVTRGQGVNGAIRIHRHHPFALGHSPARGKGLAIFNFGKHTVKTGPLPGVELDLVGFTHPQLGAVLQGADHRYVVGCGDEDGVAWGIEGLGFDRGALVGRQHLEVEGVWHIGEG